MTLGTAFKDQQNPGQGSRARVQSQGSGKGIDAVWSRMLDKIVGKIKVLCGNLSFVTRAWPAAKPLVNAAQVQNVAEFFDLNRGPL